ncbi:biosynthetic-type acetolactate synthase large subunit [Lentisphaerota bacterium ZTH]|nr:biosynthetic-type acetolactate synthase large subunit [Lentisphaerota bacterium]WET06046.1 biosynthetic-type acetolactate synthase large subunit [Lentisphaerota bacterium ZTH]
MNKNKKTLKGNQITIKCLENEGVDTIFAYPGGFSMELHQALTESDIRVILPRHEQGGAFAADGYARATGRVGVCMATSGPGATNLLTGIADAYMDSIPMVCITGQVPSSMIGKNVFQETDIIGMTRPIIKHSYLVLDASELPGVIKEAFYLAKSGRPGPVIVDIPKNVQQQVCEVDFNVSVDVKAYDPNPAMRQEDIDAFKEMLQACERPCLYVGGGIISSESSAELRKFAEGYNLPTVTTLMGVGCFPEDHPLSLKWLGMHGTVYGNNAANECDLLIALGARFDDRVTGDPRNFATQAKIIHVDIDNSEINKNKPADLGIVANVKDILAELNKAPVFKEYKEWFARIDAWKKKYPLSYKEKTDRVQPQYVMEKLCEMTNGEAVIVPGVGQHQMWSAQFYTYSFPRQFLTSGGLGSMGFGLPAAMGAKVARPDALVINIDGDGSFQMNIQELGTLHINEIGVKMIILNNQHLGMVAQWEDRFYGSRRGDTVMKNDRVERPYPDFVTIARGYEIPGREVYTREELEPALREMLEADGPFILDIHTGYDEHVLPMIPPGKDYRSIITE